MVKSYIVFLTNIWSVTLPPPSSLLHDRKLKRSRRSNVISYFHRVIDILDDKKQCEMQNVHQRNNVGYRDFRRKMWNLIIKRNLFTIVPLKLWLNSTLPLKSQSDPPYPS